MRLNKNIAAVIIIIVGLIILIGLVWFMFLAPTPAPDVVVNDPVDEGQAGVDTTLPQGQENFTPPTAPRRSPQASREMSESEVRRLAGSAVERYGTYSNQAGYENIKDLSAFMSRAFLERSRQTIEQAQAAGADTSLYYGMTTEAAVINTTSFDSGAGSGLFRVQAQRHEFIGSPDNARPFQQEAVVRMVKEGGIWKVDAIVWEEE
jgi:hypothetical protein